MTGLEKAASSVPKHKPIDFWEILETYVAGIMYDDRHVILPRLALREQVWLRREPDNDSDPNAVKVEDKSGEHFGYIPRELAAQIAPHMDSDGRPIAATITELISDTAGVNFRVRISFRLRKDSLAPNPTVLSQEIEYHYEDSGPNIYVLVNGSEAAFNEVKRSFNEDGMSYLRSGLCYRPANNGHQYQWYLKIDRTSGATQERIDRFFRDHFDVISDRERAKELEETKQKYQSEILNLQEQLTGFRQEARAYEDLAEEIDAKSKQTKVILEQKIHDLEGHAKYLQEQIGKIDDEKRTLRHEYDSLKVSLLHSNFDPRGEDIPDSVSDTLLNIVAESLTLSQSLAVISAIFPNRVLVLDTARKSANDSNVFRDRKKAFELLWKLATEYWSMLVSGRGDCDARAVFSDAYSAKESETVEHNQRARRLRTFTYYGKEIEMMKHLKIGMKHSVAETLRIHFAWDAEGRRVVIGHCGAHLDQK